jgi:CDP-glucose 4,6-dehydratase
LEALRLAGRRVAAVLVTTDKCYENPEDGLPRLEGDRLGGRDPYSSSKAAAEIAAAAYRQSFFGSPGAPQVATARAGNVIGGGDWAADRLLPDLARAFLGGQPAVIRRPEAVRPWQHVLEPLCGYLVLAERLAGGFDPGGGFASAWNFGPEPEDALTVAAVADLMAAAWEGRAAWEARPEPGAPFESGLLRLSVAKARESLGWRPRWRAAEAVRRAAAWYGASGRPGFEARGACLRDIKDYFDQGGEAS